MPTNQSEMTRIALLVLCALAPFHSSLVSAQVDCSAEYSRIEEIYKIGTPYEYTRTALDSLERICIDDREVMERLLLLRSIVNHRDLASAAMFHDLERLFRNDRHARVKATDALLRQYPEVFEAYHDVVMKQLQKDHGRIRVGVLLQIQQPQIDVTSDRRVFQEDAPLNYEGRKGWAGGIAGEYDLIPNLALRMSSGLSEWRYEASSNTQFYKEKCMIATTSVGVKKSLWVGNSPWVPYVIAEGLYGRVLSADAEIGRSGDGLRFLPPRSVDRTNERVLDQYWVGGVLGVSRKISDVVVGVEARYQYALTTITDPDRTYTETELLTNYYWLDNELSLSNFGLGLSIQYVLRYHTRNRIYP